MDEQIPQPEQQTEQQSKPQISNPFKLFKKINFLYIILVIVSILLLSFLARNNTLNSISSFFTSSVKISNNIPTDWEVYSNPSFNFQIKHPPNWKPLFFKKTKKNPDRIIFKINQLNIKGRENEKWPSYNPFEIEIESNLHNITLEDIISVEEKKSYTSLSKTKFKSLKAYLIKRKQENQQDSKESEELIFIANNNMFLLRMNYDQEEKYFRSIFKKMLSSFVYSHDDKNYIFIPTPTPTPSSIGIRKKDSTDYIYKVKSKNLNEYNLPEIFKWNDYLIYVLNGDWDKENKFTKKYIEQYNLTSGEKRIIFSSSKQNTAEGRLFYEIINDTMFFSFNAYMAKNPVYYIDLNTDKDVKILIQEYLPNKFEKIGSKHFILGGWGDACGSKIQYIEFDPVTKQVWPAFSSYGGCNHGEEYIGSDSQGNIILTVHEEDKRLKRYAKTYPNPEMGTYKYVIKINNRNPSDRINLVSRVQMPDFVTVVRFFEKENMIVLYGKELYVFNLNTNTLEKVIDIPENWLSRPSLFSLKNNILCIHSQISINESHKSVWHYSNVNLETKTVEKSDLACEEENESQTQALISPEEYLQKLSLPDNYEIFYE